MITGPVVNGMVPRPDQYCTTGYVERLGHPGVCEKCYREVRYHNPLHVGDAVAVEPAPESALLEAQRLVHGQRNKDYGSPAEDWGRIAAMARALFGWEMTAADAALFMVLVKVSRERNRPKRDNRVDIAGYAEVVDWIHRDQEAK